MFLGVVYGIIVFMSRSTGCGVWLGGLGVWCVVMSDCEVCGGWGVVWAGCVVLSNWEVWLGVE